MPYIKQEDRAQYGEALDSLSFILSANKWNAGHVTYVLYNIICDWFKDKPCYLTIAKIRGCLVGTMTEFDRRVSAGYEDEKIKENGDVA